jgi:flagellar hook assembly protein FlgD
MSLGSTILINNISDISLLTPDGVTSVFDPQENPLTVRIGDQDVPGTTLTTYVDFIWDGDNLNGQGVMPGSYFVKVTVNDTFNTQTTIIKEVQLLKVEEYVKVSIYNSAGEIVKTVELPKTGDDIIDLNVDDVFYIGDNNSQTTIKFGNNGSLDWDGKNSLGNLVESGTYEIYVEVRSKEGYVVAASKTITVLNESVPSILGEVKAYPNPLVLSENQTGVIRIAWTGSVPGRVNIRVYNAAGEIVDKFGTDLSAGFVDWDGSTVHGLKAASGYFAAFIEAVSSSGAVERRLVKLVVIRKY